MPQEAYADTNGVSNLCSHEDFSEDELATVRRKLTAPASAFALMTSPTVLQELAPLRRNQPALCGCGLELGVR